MPQAIIHLGEREDRILTIIKGKYGLKNKSDAVNHLIAHYEEHFLEAELKPKYVKKLDELEKGRFKRYATLADARKAIEHKKP